MNADSARAVRQEVRGTETGKVVACGAAQPQSQLPASQQSPVMPSACRAWDASELESAGAESGACPAWDPIPVAACEAVAGGVARLFKINTMAIRARNVIT